MASSSMLHSIMFPGLCSLKILKKLSIPLNGPLFSIHYVFLALNHHLIINWVRTVYCNIESCVLNNGWSSNYFQPQRGVRQGCSLAPHLFILAAEVLAKSVRNNKSIRGFSLGNDDVKISITLMIPLLS